MLGAKEVKDVKGRKASEVMGPELLPFYLPLIEGAKRSGRAEEFSYRSLLNGRDYVSSFVVEGDRYIAAQRDITDIKQAQHRAEESEVKYRGLFETYTKA